MELQKLAKDFMNGNDNNLYSADLKISIFGNPVEVESVWHSYKEDKIYLHVGCKEFEGDIDIDSLSDDNQETLKNFFSPNYLESNKDNDRFIELIEEHEDDTEFDYEPDGDGWGDENRDYFIPFANAFRQLCKERGEEWANTHDWEFDSEPGNPYDVIIVER